MKHFLKSVSESPSGSLHGRVARMAWPTGIAAVLAVTAFACSDDPPVTPVPTGGTGGQVSGGGSSAGTGIVAGTSNTPTAGTAPAGGAGGMPGTSGSASGGTGGGTAGGPAGGSGGATGGGGAGGTGGAGGSGGGSGGADGFVSLFNGTNLDGWTPSQGHAGLFAAGKLGDDPVIHVYPSATLADGAQGVAQATLRTNASYSKYVLHLEYKWGVKRFNDRQGARDNGICFHLCNNLSKVWPDSVEFQLGSDTLGKDWVSGNIFMLVGNTKAQWPNARMNNQPYFSETGTKTNLGPPDFPTYALGRASAQLDKATDWNIIEMTVNGAAEAEYKVNGTVVNRLFDMQCRPDNGAWAPLDKGPIALQAEFAETYFRNIKIKVLP
jgi:hypothetical protein